MPKKFTFFTLIALFNLAANYAHPVTPTYFKLLGSTTPCLELPLP
ncbi:hypothetical protein [Ligilactobacillus equi]|nr:hypothetical protein [Ligilactobacillus equi]